MKSQGRKKGSAPNGHKESFKLPRSIVKVLKECARKHEDNGSPNGSETVKYLWMDISGDSAGKKRAISKGLCAEDWLNVVDEVVSLGVKYVVICAGASLNAHPELWTICEWAQRTYGIDVGIHTCAKQLKKSELDELKRLEPHHTWLFVKCANRSAFQGLEDAGICVLESEVGHEEQAPPCDMSQDMVFVGPEGVLYTCGLVSDDEQFRMGHVSEKRIEEYVKDPQLPHRIPQWAPHRENGCDACPPIMVKRMMGISGRD